MRERASITPGLDVSLKPPMAGALSSSKVPDTRNNMRMWLGLLANLVGVALMFLGMLGSRTFGSMYAESAFWGGVFLGIIGVCMQTNLREEKEQFEQFWDSCKRVGSKSTIAVIATLAVIIGFADQPYGYYMLLRLFLCGVSLFLLFESKSALEPWQAWTLGGFAVLYNPVVPVYLRDKDLWEIANVATVILFWIVSARRRPRG